MNHFLYIAAFAVFVSTSVDAMATCKMTGSLNGTIMIHQKEDNKNNIHFMGKVENLPAGQHGFHVHEFGKLGNQCKDAGGHFNPKNMAHGSLISTIRHEGDLENILADSNKMATIDVTLTNVNLNDFIGKSIVIHERIDDLGLGGHPDSKTTGNAGSRLDCCVIEGENSSTMEAGAVMLTVFAGLIQLLLI